MKASSIASSQLFDGALLLRFLRLNIMVSFLMYDKTARVAQLIAGVSVSEQTVLGRTFKALNLYLILFLVQFWLEPKRK